MSPKLNCFLLSLLAFCISLGLYPPTLRFARRHGIVDNPDARKLQREPVPVLGGLVVFIGFYAAAVVMLMNHGTERMMAGLTATAIMTAIGIWDDLRDLPAAFRFIVEMCVVWLLRGWGEIWINDFHGLWGLGEISLWVSAPLSIIAGVGIINAINLIDGVDGYSSGFGITACLVFGAFLGASGIWPSATMMFILAGALVPFWLHNVFGKRSKMFIGDGGSLLLGTSMTVTCFCILDEKSPCAAIADTYGVGLIPFTLAVLAIPVFDTLRVMTLRMARGNSPFSPDKTHLHHLFIEMGFSHVVTSLIICTANTLIVLCWWLSWKLGAGIDLQFYIVTTLGLLVTSGFYKFSKIQQRRQSRIWDFFCRLGARSHRFSLPLWIFVRRLVDQPILPRQCVRARQHLRKLKLQK